MYNYNVGRACVRVREPPRYRARRGAGVERGDRKIRLLSADVLFMTRVGARALVARNRNTAVFSEKG